MFAMATFIYELWSNIYAKILSFWENRKKTVFVYATGWKSIFYDYLENQAFQDIYSYIAS